MSPNILTEFGDISATHRYIRRAIRQPDAAGCLTPEWKRKNAESGRPSTGFCLVASEVLYNLIGRAESGYKLMRGKLASHNWLQHKTTGEIIDLTADQFPFAYPYETGRGVGLRNMSNNAKLLLSIMRRIHATRASC